jgi:hypothetical protein
MKAYICNQCQKQAPVDAGYDLLPEGWWSVNDRSYKVSAHVCGVPCLVNFAMRQPLPLPESLPIAEGISER